MALDVLLFVEDNVVRRRKELGGEGRTIFVTRRPNDGRFLFFLYVVSVSSLFTVSGMSLLGLLS